MSLSELDAVCRNCGERFRAVPQRTFLGFQGMNCPKCGKMVIYPLTTGYRRTWWGFIILLVAAFVIAYTAGVVVRPGLLVLIGIYALVKDARIKKEVAAAESAPRPAAA